MNVTRKRIRKLCAEKIRLLWYNQLVGGFPMEKRIHAAADQTKQALAAALKKWMAQKPMDKMTIHDLTECCGIRRQNFYCHFADIYDLMRWMFQEEAVSLLRQHEGTLL